MSNHGNTTGVNEGPSSFESASTGSSVAHSTSETHSKNNASSYETFADLPVHRQIDLADRSGFTVRQLTIANVPVCSEGCEAELKVLADLTAYIRNSNFKASPPPSQKIAESDIIKTKYTKLSYDNKEKSGMDYLKSRLLLIDSGSGRHICGDDRLFIQGSIRPTNVNVILGDDVTKIHASKAGDIWLDKDNGVMLRNVLLIPGFEHIVVAPIYLTRTSGKDAAIVTSKVARENKICSDADSSMWLITGLLTNKPRAKVFRPVIVQDMSYAYLDESFTERQFEDPEFMKRYMVSYKSVEDFVAKEGMLETVKFARVSLATELRRTERVISDIMSIHDIAHINYGAIIDGLKNGLYQVSYDYSKDPSLLEGILPMLPHCTTCHMSKMKDVYHPLSAKVVKKPGDQLSADLKVKLPKGLYGEENALIIVDKFSHYVWTFPLKQKSAAVLEIGYLVSLLENQLGWKPKVLRTDNGGEFTSNQFEAFLKGKGIIHQYSVPYVHQHNGIAEANIRVVFSYVRAALHACGGHHAFWPYCMQYVAFAMNNLIPRDILIYSVDVNGNEVVTRKVMVAEQVLSGRRVRTDACPPFGCDASIWIPTDQRKPGTTLEPRAVSGIFLGHPQGRPGGLFFCPSRNRVVVAQSFKVYRESFSQMALCKNGTYKLDDHIGNFMDEVDCDVVFEP
ncbi:uncharacterized protein SAPINGB_P002447 [Magnusiomyces paraingens]|uniref:Integrase catalytic domain-containing protein n=1 Tax=Magnusiomyces paraingens TaxID=2606893 RepID=A0A5E8BDZ1_9ASCO|nr:uncharacterized protein SAPINGB_P002447 [Saprochaete ingens]VVT49795.1 unnamed protein product [Saprochaete ingens]